MTDESKDTRNNFMDLKTSANERRKSLPQVSELRRVIKVMSSRRIVVFGAIIILLLILTAVFAPLIAPYNPYKQNLSKTLQQPSMEYFLGTDPVGRDILSRLIYGSRASLMVGIVSVGIATIIGMSLGLIAGYFGGWINSIIMRIIDTMMAIPPLVLTLAIAALLGGGLKNVMIALGIGLVPTYCRLMCGQVISIKESDFVNAARVIGVSDFNIMIRHLLPNAFPPLLVLITLNMGMAILAEAGLSFLGVGIESPGAAWGAMVSEGYRYLLANPVLSFAPGIAVILVVLSFNMVGDGLRDALDPKLRGTL